MKVYVLSIDMDDFEYDEIADVVVSAESPEQAIELAKEVKDVKWHIEYTVELDKPRVLGKFAHHG